MPEKEPRRKLPPVDAVLREEALQDVLPRARALVVDCTRRVLASWRELLSQEGKVAPPIEEIAREVLAMVENRLQPSLKRVINATGVVLHTNLGRAPLSRAACEAVINAARYYCNLELELLTGKRGKRYDHVEQLLCELTGAEAALVVNNNAAAVLLALNTLAAGKETIVSRGQLVEIGGAFRVPEIMAQSGSRLVEVGTTNKTYLRDYRRAITGETALLLKVHPSNYRVLGFTQEVTTAELVALGREVGLPVMEDLGSGVLVDLAPWGLRGEPTVQEELAAGVDVLTFSGDKLLGGPQAGIILGRRKFISRMQENPLTRALRIDKLTLAGLEATLHAYRETEQALAEIPVLKMLTLPPEKLRSDAENLRIALSRELGDKAELEVIEGFSEAGGGSLPLAQLPTFLVAVRSKTIGAGELAARLRQAKPPVLARIQAERLLLDVRTLLPGEEEELCAALRAVLE